MIDNYGIEYLRPNVIVLKSLDQDISDPIIAGAGEAGGNKLIVVFTQEAAARFTPETKVYLNWRHQDLDNVCGFDMFQEQETEEGISVKCGTPHCIWSIGWPRNMKHEGTVEASIVLLDAVSKDETVHFNINVLSDLNGSEGQMDEEEFSIFEQALLDMNKSLVEVRELLDEAQGVFDNILDLQEQLENELQEVKDEQEQLKKQQEDLTQAWKDFLAEHENYEDRIKRLEEQMYIWFAYHGLAYYPRINTSDIIAPGLPEYNTELRF